MASPSNVNVPVTKTNFKEKIPNVLKNNKEIIKDWAEVSSIHGVPHIAAAKTKFVKCIWISILIFCFTIFMILLFLNGLVEYLGYPTVVNFESRSDEIDFPAVTFCHASPYSMKKIENSQYTNLKNVINAYKKLNI